MRRRHILTVSASSGLCVLASLPYNPTRILSISNGSAAYFFSPASSSQFSLSLLDTSNNVFASDPVSSTLYPTLPFLSSSKSKAFMPLASSNGDMSVLAGDCTDAAEGLELWKFTRGGVNESGSWSQSQITLSDALLSADYLSAGFVFSATGAPDQDSVYVFGGMCPNTTSTTSSDWTSDALYSNTMLTISAGSSNTGELLDVSMTGSRAPPIAEAGLTITPMIPTSSNSSGNMSQQQNFVLLGGHTQNAFVNMSQIALFTLPEESWAFLAVDQPGANWNTELTLRTDTVVEPRSGHTAILTEDGSKVIVYGGWVGDISTPATPQLAVLEIGQGYGGNGNWAWTVPTQTMSPFTASQGIYGHGAAMLPGGVMIIGGGYLIESRSNVKRQPTQTTSDKIFFFNTTSSSWMSSYVNPSSPESPLYTGTGSSAKGPIHTTSQKAGLGVGLGLGFAAIAALIAIWLWYTRRLETRRSIREKELRELALGAERYHSGPMAPGSMDGAYHHYPEMRTASWGSRQEKRIGDPGEDYPWAPVITEEKASKLRINHEQDEEDSGYRGAERTGLLMDVPSPTRGLRRSLVSRGPPAAFGPAVGGAPSSVFRIEEEDEGSPGGSLKRTRSSVKSGTSSSVRPANDPFKDPPPPVVPEYLIDPAAAQRKREVQGWMEDWRAADENMRFPQHRKPGNNTGDDRTYSDLTYHSASGSKSGTNTSSSGRGSPDKSDRTGSNLSEQSVYSSMSIQRSITGTLSRNISQRSASAGYALFAGAAAAMARSIGGGASVANRTSPNSESYGTVNTGKGAISRAPSKRSTSLNFSSTGSSTRTQGHQRKRSETFSTARTSLGPILLGEDQALLSRMNTRAIVDEREYWATPPESPVKDFTKHTYTYDRSGSLGSQAGRKALGLLGSVKRVFTGTGSVDVQDRVSVFESAARTDGTSPVKDRQRQMMEVEPKRAASASATFWRGKQGKRDWEDGSENQMPEGIGNIGPSMTIPRKPLPGREKVGEIEEDWDPEAAVQNRVVQVMFTVPKEKLRVVNVDALSLLSKSDVDFEGAENELEVGKEVKRMSSVVEKEEAEDIEAAVTMTEGTHHLDLALQPVEKNGKGEKVKKSDMNEEEEEEEEEEDIGVAVEMQKESHYTNAPAQLVEKSDRAKGKEVIKNPRYAFEV